MPAHVWRAGPDRRPHRARARGGPQTSAPHHRGRLLGALATLAAAAVVVTVGATGHAPAIPSGSPSSATEAGASLTDIQLAARAKKLTTCSAGQLPNLVVAPGEPVRSLVKVEADPRVDWNSSKHPAGFTPGVFLVNGHEPPQ